jgi:hypothetical protein
MPTFPSTLVDASGCGRVRAVIRLASGERPASLMSSLAIAVA